MCRGSIALIFLLFLFARFEARLKEKKAFPRELYGFGRTAGAEVWEGAEKAARKAGSQLVQPLVEALFQLFCLLIDKERRASYARTDEIGALAHAFGGAIDLAEDAVEFEYLQHGDNEIGNEEGKAEGDKYRSQKLVEQP